MISARNDDGGFNWLFLGLPLVMIPMFLFFSASKSGPESSIPNSDVYGCYQAADAPSILLDAQGLHIHQNGFPTIPYHIERHKTGYALVADRPIKAERTDKGFVYGFYSPGEGLYLDFFHVVNGKKYGVFEGVPLSNFSMLARDGSYLDYSKTRSNDGCSNGPEDARKSKGSPAAKRL